jgi:hypothetical protein
MVLSEVFDNVLVIETTVDNDLWNGALTKHLKDV